MKARELMVDLDQLEFYKTVKLVRWEMRLRQISIYSSVLSFIFFFSFFCYIFVIYQEQYLTDQIQVKYDILTKLVMSSQVISLFGLFAFLFVIKYSRNTFAKDIKDGSIDILLTNFDPFSIIIAKTLSLFIPFLLGLLYAVCISRFIFISYKFELYCFFLLSIFIGINLFLLSLVFISYEINKALEVLQASVFSANSKTSKYKHSYLFFSIFILVHIVNSIILSAAKNKEFMIYSESILFILMSLCCIFCIVILLLLSKKLENIYNF